MKPTNQERVKRSMDKLHLSQTAKERLLSLEEQPPTPQKKPYKWVAPIAAVLALTLLSAAAIHAIAKKPQAPPQPTQPVELQAPLTSLTPVSAPVTEPSEGGPTGPPPEAADTTHGEKPPIPATSTPVHQPPTTPPTAEPTATAPTDTFSPTPYLDFCAPESYGTAGGFTGEGAGCIPVYAYFRQENGTDILLFVRDDTGEQYTLDITGQLIDSSYSASLILFECSGTVRLTVSDTGYTLSWLAD